MQFINSTGNTESLSVLPMQWSRTASQVLPAQQSGTLTKT